MPPTLVISMLMGSLYGLVFFLLASGRNALYYWGAGVAGFVIGQVLGEYVHVTDIRVGDVHVVEASLVCWGFLFVLYNLGPTRLRRRG